MLEKPSSTPSPEDKGYEKLLNIACLILLVLLLFIVVFAASLVNAQEKDPRSKSLKIGDRLPDVPLNTIVNHRDQLLNLSDFKGKLLILDFWGTWCSSCRKKLPETQELQNRFKSEMQVLLVSGEKKEKVQAFFDKAALEGNPFILPSVAEDTILSNLFKHKLVPHLVWISPDGIVKSITSEDQLNADNIRAMLDGTSAMSEKKDLDTSKPLFMDSDLPSDAGYTVFISGRIDGLSSGRVLRTSAGVLHGKAITNTLLLDMYQSVAAELMPDFNLKRMVLEIKDSSLLIPSNDSGTEWYRKHYSTIDLRIPVSNADSLYHYMLRDLNRYSPYSGTQEKRKVQCLVLTAKKGQEEKFRSKGGKRENSLFYKAEPAITNYPVSLMVSRLNERSDLSYPVIDETGYPGNIDIRITGPLDGLHQLQQALSDYGLNLKLQERLLPMFVLRDDLLQPPRN